MTALNTSTDLSGKVALVTGGSRGIGAAIADRLAQCGADVALTYVSNKERATEVADRITRRGRTALAINADSADVASVVGAVNQTVATLGRLDLLARELGPRGVTVNLVHPGPTNTDLNPADGPTADGIRSHTALGRYAEPAEIAALVAFLAGPDGAYVTSAELTVDGGFNI